ncbi:protein-L-isoaspartate(D-aspartate) O-methyltransferase (plasmid) [Sinorhizobium kummerowiae]|uniref:Protein-L-isoaspartate O-methyltransferase n=1 Tax=Sinorhizobium kummerowiae TaxID=158892 RepID=A0ABY8T134_9HYPH|nr:protein-L-isoaspartate(D-aspartate) O-methyltransferase [Sinorhizobium kummerowiae]WHS90915.1 protein-L-isoaspartate(D-aspartate) O-methyltransferase [Sinorhizobium kummerowiae]WRW49344.1 protein-L-isoaspartate(D-aspartate) O-methyltransferase [Sinorhizobium kummerowiae]
MIDFSRARERMITSHLSRRGIRDRHVVEAMGVVPREAFVDPGFEEFAYEDSALSISHGQTISQPYIVALMIERAEVQPGDTVLEIGTGSGYAAAVLSRIAAYVYTIERHAGLAEVAERRFAELRYGNIDVRVGDGTAGWPEAGPFDAILVAAGGPEIPYALKEQLDLGGHLVIPVGPPEEQRLMKVTRVNATTFEEQDLGGVRFVPLVGEHGWHEERVRARLRPAPTLPELVAEAAEPLPDLDDPAFGPLFDRFAGRRVVLLGEASHGTSEFYRARAAITRRLIEEHGFTIVAVEADWPDAAAVDRYVRHRTQGMRLDAPFQRFPTWMWRNREVMDFVEWMREHNGRRSLSDRAGFYGLDIYNMRGSISAVLRYLDETDPEAAAVARERYGCLTPWQNEPSTYGRATMTAGFRKCEEAVAKQCRELLERQLEAGRDSGDELLDAVQNARLVASAERYYRVMYYAGADSWNMRDTHMFETLEHLLNARGARSKAVVWAHNSHIGDARHTDMGTAREELNIGQLCRERFGDQAALIGFGTHGGHVAAANDWDGDMEVKPIRPSLDGSYERVMHDSGVGRCLIDFARHARLRDGLLKPMLERFIGVIYRPDTERFSHYAHASLPRQFDAFVWFDQTTPVEPLGAQHIKAGVPDTFPFGL